MAVSITGTELHFEIRYQQGRGGVLVWVCIINVELHLFGLKIDSKIGSEKQQPVVVVQEKSAPFKTMILMQEDDAPSHASKY